MAQVENNNSDELDALLGDTHRGNVRRQINEAQGVDSPLGYQLPTGRDATTEAEMQRLMKGSGAGSEAELMQLLGVNPNSPNFSVRRYSDGGSSVPNMPANPLSALAAGNPYVLEMLKKIIPPVADPEMHRTQGQDLYVNGPYAKEFGPTMVPDPALSDRDYEGDMQPTRDDVRQLNNYPTDSNISDFINQYGREALRRSEEGPDPPGYVPLPFARKPWTGPPTPGFDGDVGADAMPPGVTLRPSDREQVLNDLFMAMDPDGRLDSPNDSPEIQQEMQRLFAPKKRR